MIIHTNVWLYRTLVRVYMPSNGAVDIITGHCCLISTLFFISFCNNLENKRKDRTEACGHSVPSERIGQARGGTSVSWGFIEALQNPEPGIELSPDKFLNCQRWAGLTGRQANPLDSIALVKSCWNSSSLWVESGLGPIVFLVNFLYENIQCHQCNLSSNLKLLSIANLFCLRLEHLNLDRGQEGLVCVFITFFFIFPLILLPRAAPEPPGTEQGQRRGNRQRHGNDVSWPIGLCSADVHKLNYYFLQCLWGLLGASTDGNLFKWECPR